MSFDADSAEALESVYFRFVSTDDDKLPAAIYRVLPRILRMTAGGAGSPPAGGRSPVAQIATIVAHLLKRIRSMPPFPLPVGALLEIVADVAAGNLPTPAAVLSFSFLETAILALPPREAAQACMCLLAGVSRLPAAQQATVLHLFVRALPGFSAGLHCDLDTAIATAAAERAAAERATASTPGPGAPLLQQLPAGFLETRRKALLESADDKELIVSVITDLFLFSPESYSHAAASATGMPAPQPGFSAASQHRFTRGGRWVPTSSDLLPLRKAAVGFLFQSAAPAPEFGDLTEAGIAAATEAAAEAAAATAGSSAPVVESTHALTPAQAYPPLLVASVSAAEGVPARASEALKRLPRLSLHTDKPLFDRLCALYLGGKPSRGSFPPAATTAPAGVAAVAAAPGAAPVDPEVAALASKPAPPAVKLRILEALRQTRLSAIPSATAPILRVMTDALFAAAPAAAPAPAPAPGAAGANALAAAAEAQRWRDAQTQAQLQGTGSTIKTKSAGIALVAWVLGRVSAAIALTKRVRRSRPRTGAAVTTAGDDETAAIAASPLPRLLFPLLLTLLQKISAEQASGWAARDAASRSMRAFLSSASTLPADKVALSTAARDQQWAKLRGEVYYCLGSLAAVAPSVANKSLDVFELLLAPIEGAASAPVASAAFAAAGAGVMTSGNMSDGSSNVDPALRQSCLEALALLRPAFSPRHCPAPVRAALRTRLSELLGEGKRRRLLALQWLNRLFPFEDCGVRFVCAAMAADTAAEVRTEAKFGLHPSAGVGAEAAADDEGEEALPVEDDDEGDGEDEEDASRRAAIAAAAAAKEGPRYPSFKAFAAELRARLDFSTVLPLTLEGQISKSTPSAAPTDSGSSPAGKPMTDDDGYAEDVDPVASLLRTGSATAPRVPLSVLPAATLRALIDFSLACLRSDSTAAAAAAAATEAAAAADAAAAAVEVEEAPLSPGKVGAARETALSRALTLVRTPDPAEAEATFLSKLLEAESSFGPALPAPAPAGVAAVSTLHALAEAGLDPTAPAALQEAAAGALLRLIRAAPGPFAALLSPRTHWLLRLLLGASSADARVAAAVTLAEIAPGMRTEDLVTVAGKCLAIVDHSKMDMGTRRAVARAVHICRGATNAAAAAAASGEKAKTAVVFWPGVVAEGGTESSKGVTSEPRLSFFAPSRAAASPALALDSVSLAPLAGGDEEAPWLAGKSAEAFASPPSSLRLDTQAVHGALLALGVAAAQVATIPAVSAALGWKRSSSPSESRLTPELAAAAALVPLAARVALWWVSPSLGAQTRLQAPDAVAASLQALARVSTVGPLTIARDPAPTVAVGSDPVFLPTFPAAVEWLGALVRGAVQSRADTAAAAATIGGGGSVNERFLQQQQAQQQQAQQQQQGEATGPAAPPPRQPGRLSEHAALALGALAIGDRSLPALAAVRPTLVALGSVKHEETHFAVGQAWVMYVSGCVLDAGDADIADLWPFSAVRGSSTAYSPEVLRSRESFTRATQPLLVSLLSEAAEWGMHGSLAMRAATVVWVLCLVRHFARFPEFVPMANPTQTILMRALSESDPFLQEAASKALSLLHELTPDPATKQELIDTLVRTFTATTGARGNADTAIDTGRGGFSTYRELVAAANDMGQPNLVYRFMDLAAHNALWTSRAGAAFSLGTLLARTRAGSPSSSSSASDEDLLPPGVAPLIPKLFRYRYDPNPKIKASMAALWGVLIPSPARATAQFFGPITRELLSGLQQRSYRTRQASCLALVDVLTVPGLDRAKLAELVGELWPLLLRTLDDIHEDVRKSGLRLARTVSTVTLRLCDPSRSGVATAEAAIAAILPTLLEKGLPSPVKDIRSVSLAALLGVAKIGGVALRPRVPAVLVTLLEGLSSLEPAAFAYMQFHASAVDMSPEQMERLRVSVARGSPLHEAIECCLALVDASIVKETAQRLADVIRIGVGLQTLVTASKAIATLVSTSLRGINVVDMKPALSDAMPAVIKILCNAIVDPSPTLRKAYSHALAHCCRVAKRKRLLKVIALLADLAGTRLGSSAAMAALLAPSASSAAAFGEDSAATEEGPTVSTPSSPAFCRLAAATALRELLTVTPESVRDCAADVAPIAFLGMHLSQQTVPRPPAAGLRGLPSMLAGGATVTAAGTSAGTDTPAPAAPAPAPAAVAGEQQQAPEDALRSLLSSAHSFLSASAGTTAALFGAEQAIRNIGADAAPTPASATSPTGGSGAAGAATTAPALAATDGSNEGEAAELFRSVWAEITAGDASGALVYAREIASLALAVTNDTYAEYVFKAAALNAVESLALLTHSSLPAVISPDALLEQLASVAARDRVWAGKERALGAIVAVLAATRAGETAAAEANATADAKSPSVVSKVTPKTLITVFRALIGETERNKASYQKRALAALGQAAAVYPAFACAPELPAGGALGAVRRCLERGILPSDLAAGALAVARAQVSGSGTGAASAAAAGGSAATGAAAAGLGGENATGLNGARLTEAKANSLLWEVSLVAISNSIPPAAGATAVPGAVAAMKEHGEWALGALCCGLTSGLGWNAKLAALEGIAAFAARAPPSHGPSRASELSQETLDVILTAAAGQLDDMKFRQLRLAALRVIAASIDRVRSPAPAPGSVSKVTVSTLRVRPWLLQRLRRTQAEDPRGEVVLAAGQCVGEVEALLKSAPPAVEKGSEDGKKGVDADDGAEADAGDI